MAVCRGQKSPSAKASPGTERTDKMGAGVEDTDDPQSRQQSSKVRPKSVEDKIDDAIDDAIDDELDDFDQGQCFVAYGRPLVAFTSSFAVDSFVLTRSLTWAPCVDNKVIAMILYFHKVLTVLIPRSPLLFF